LGLLHSETAPFVLLAKSKAEVPLHLALDRLRELQQIHLVYNEQLRPMAIFRSYKYQRVFDGVMPLLVVVILAVHD
jgi:hypothetical protein